MITIALSLFALVFGQTTMTEVDIQLEPQPVSPDDLTQYRMAADIANRTILSVANECVIGRRVVDLCIAGDKMINDAVCTQTTTDHICS